MDSKSLMYPNILNEGAIFGCGKTFIATWMITAFYALAVCVSVYSSSHLSQSALSSQWPSFAPIFPGIWTPVFWLEISHFQPSRFRPSPGKLPSLLFALCVIPLPWDCISRVCGTYCMYFSWTFLLSILSFSPYLSFTGTVTDSSDTQKHGCVWGGCESRIAQIADSIYMPIESNMPIKSIPKMHVTKGQS